MRAIAYPSLARDNAAMGFGHVQTFLLFIFLSGAVYAVTSHGADSKDKDLASLAATAAAQAKNAQSGKQLPRTQGGPVPGNGSITNCAVPGYKYRVMQKKGKITVECEQIADCGMQPPRTEPLSGGPPPKLYVSDILKMIADKKPLPKNTNTKGGGGGQLCKGAKPLPSTFNAKEVENNYKSGKCKSCEVQVCAEGGCKKPTVILVR